MNQYFQIFERHSSSMCLHILYHMEINLLYIIYRLIDELGEENESMEAELENTQNQSAAKTKHRRIGSLAAVFAGVTEGEAEVEQDLRRR